MMKLLPCPSCDAMAPEFATTCKFCGAAIDPFADDTPGPPAEVSGLDASAVASPAVDPSRDQPDPAQTSVTADELTPATVNDEPDDGSNDEPDDTDEERGAGPSPWSRAGSVGASGAAVTAPAPGPSVSAPAPPTGGPTPRPDPTPSASSITTERAPTAPSAPPLAPTARVTPKPRSAGARAGNRVVRVVVIALSIVVLGVVVLVVIGQFGAGPIGKQKEAVAGRGDWITYTDPAGAFTVQLPTEPSVSSRQTDFGAPWQSVKSQAGLSAFEVSTVDYSEGMPGVYAQQWLDRQPAFMAEGRGKVVDSRRIVVQGNAGIEYAIEGTDGWFSRGAIVTIGRRAYLFEVVARSDSPDGLQRMLQTFTPLPVDQK